jgi:pentatricopeptide repeat protein
MLKPNDYVLGCMLDAMVTNDHVEDAVALFEKWKTVITPNTVIYCTIIKGFTNTRQSWRAMELFSEMKDTKVQLDTFVFNTLIDSQARTGGVNEVNQLLQEMQQCGCKPDGMTNATVIKCYLAKGDVDKAFEVFSSMQDSSTSAESVYNTMLDGCTRHNRMDLADLVLRDMENFQIKPSNHTLGILVKMFGRRKQLGKAFDVLEEISQKYGMQPNLHVKNCLLCACLKSNRVDRAYQVFENMKSCGQGIDAKSYGALIQGNIKLGNLQEAVRLVREAYGIRQHRGLPHNQTIESEPMEQLMRALQYRGEIQSMGMQLLEDLRSANLPVSGRLLSSMMDMQHGWRLKEG